MRFEHSLSEYTVIALYILTWKYNSYSILIVSTMYVPQCVLTIKYYYWRRRRKEEEEENNNNDVELRLGEIEDALQLVFSLHSKT